MITRKPGEAASEELDHPKLRVSLLKKGEKEPLLLKAGWKDVVATSPAEEPEEQKTATAGKQPPEKGKEPSATKDQGKVSEEKQPPAPANALAVVQPSEEEGAVFTVDGDFVTRIRQDLQRITEEK